ncbi:MAG: LOG family protein [Candidatus Dadabacteria bacterium]|nr:MAG: LOG family protein [Candidatus Dadabacteria bacterium]
MDRKKKATAEQFLDFKAIKQRKKYLDERLQYLYRRALALEKELRKLDEDKFFRVCIFGSARISPNTKAYKEVFELARMLAWEGIDVLTGGGPGLMEAANRGATLGRKEKNSQSLSFGISIELPFEPRPNSHLDIKRHHHKFSSRLDDFMRLSHAVVCTPGGVGTLLEFFFTWQLVQVKHISKRPIVLLDKSYWEGLIDWTKEVPLARKLISPEDFQCIKIVDQPKEAFEIISKEHKKFLEKKNLDKKPAKS